MRTISARCPYLADELKAPLYATPFTAGLIAGKLEEEGLTGQVKLNIVERGGSDRARAVPRQLRRACRIRFPKGNGLLIETPFGNVFHTGDWKIDETPVIGEAPSTEALTRDRRRRRARARVRFDQRLPGRSRRARRRASTPGCSRKVDRGEGPRAGHHLRVQRRAAADDRPGRARDRPPGLHRRPLARTHPARRPGDRLSPRFPAADQLRRSDAPAAKRGADHRHRRAGRAARRAWPHRRRHARAQARRRRHGHLLVADHSRATRSRSAAS